MTQRPTSPTYSFRIGNETAADGNGTVAIGRGMIAKGDDWLAIAGVYDGPAKVDTEDHRHWVQMAGNMLVGRSVNSIPIEHAAGRFADAMMLRLPGGADPYGKRREQLIFAILVALADLASTTVPTLLGKPDALYLVEDAARPPGGTP